jgi:hypothetical protein
MLRQDAARKEACRRISAILQERRRRLMDEKVQREALVQGREAIRRLRFEDLRLLLLPAVRALDDPDLASLRKPLAAGLRDLLGSWQFEYLALFASAGLLTELFSGDRGDLDRVQRVMAWLAVEAIKASASGEQRRPSAVPP